MDKIIKARFLRDGEPMGREYTYLSKEQVEVGTKVTADTQRGEADLIVTAIDVPESECEAFKDRLKYINGPKKEETAEEPDCKPLDLGI